MMTATCRFGDDTIEVVCTRKEASLDVECIERKSGRRWGPVPLLKLEVYAKAEFRVETAASFRIDQVEATSDGMHVTVGDRARHVRLGVWLHVRNGELVVRMPMTELYEDKPQTHRTFSVILLPGLMATRDRLLVPAGPGYTCRVAAKPRITDRFLIYGEQPRWELLPLMPLGAAYDDQGGLLLLATEAAGEAECHAWTDGAGKGGLNFGFSIRQNWPDPVEFATREFRYIPIPPKADAMHFAAKRLRRHVMEDLGKPTLRQRIEESPELRYLRDAYTMKMFFGVENVGIMMDGQPKGDPVTFRRVMTFKECKDILGRFHAAGIDKVLTKAVGYNPRGHDGMWPTRFPIDERLGGETGFRDLIAHGTRLGYQMNVHDNQLGAYVNSPDFDVEKVIHDQWGPMGGGEWGGGITYVLNALALPQEWIEGQMRGLKALGLQGMAYLDGMGNPLYRDYHPRHRMSRSGYAQGVQRLLKAAGSVYGAVGTECGFLYAALPADYICIAGIGGIRCWPEWPVTALLDEVTPVYPLAIHGLLFIERQCGIPTWQDAMDGVLWGLHPRVEWSAHPGIMPVADEAFIARVKAVYDVGIRRFGYLQEQEILFYADSGDGMRQTRFADGTEVVADFTKGELIVNGQPVPPPAVLVR